MIVVENFLTAEKSKTLRVMILFRVMVDKSRHLRWYLSEVKWLQKINKKFKIKCVKIASTNVTCHNANGKISFWICIRKSYANKIFRIALLIQWILWTCNRSSNTRSSHEKNANFQFQRTFVSDFNLIDPHHEHKKRVSSFLNPLQITRIVKRAT